jgi:hypothetical protein
MKRAALVIAAFVIAGCHGGPATGPTQPPGSTPAPAGITSISIASPACSAGVCGGSVGGTVQLTATAALSDGSALDVTNRAQWSSTNTSVAAVNSSGLVSFAAAGDAEIAAAYQGVSGREAVHAIDCSYAPAQVSAFNAVGGSGSVSVGASSACRWSAVTQDFWIHVTAPASSSGPQAVRFAVDPNQSLSGRSGAIAIMGDHGDTLARYTVTQHSAGCLYTTAATLSLPPLGTYDGSGDGPVPVSVHAEPADCQWTATPSVPWIRIVYGSNRGIGDGRIYVSVIEWNMGPARSGDVRIAGLSGVNPEAHLAVTQAGR